VFTLDKGRAHDVPENHFGEKARGIVVVDRYSAYKAMKHVKEGRLLWPSAGRTSAEISSTWKRVGRNWRLGGRLAGTNR
jgi:hypothetical protein